MGKYTKHNVLQLKYLNIEEIFLSPGENWCWLSHSLDESIFVKKIFKILLGWVKDMGQASDVSVIKLGGVHSRIS